MCGRRRPRSCEARAAAARAAGPGPTISLEHGNMNNPNFNY